jgi:hypothetical protein
VNTDVAFCRALLAQAHNEVKAEFPDVNLREDVWVWKASRDHWEFHGPDDFYWHGTASNTFEARYKGWMAWLKSKGRV